MTVEGGYEAKFSFCATIGLIDGTISTASLSIGVGAYLALVEDFLRHFAFERFHWLLPLQDLVLTEGKKGFKQILREREADNQTFPWELRSVQEASEALEKRWELAVTFKFVFVFVSMFMFVFMFKGGMRAE